MANSFTITSFFALLCCILTGMLMAWLLYRKSDTLSRNLRLLLAVIRAISVSLILWLLFSPLIKQVSYTLEKPIVIIAQDNSQSIAAFTAAGFDRAKYQHDMEQLVKELSDKYEVRSYSFSDSVANKLDFDYKGTLSNVSVLERKLTDEYVNRNVGGIILATDGIFNGEGNGAGIAALQAPVYTLALGDTIPKKDILISNINHNDLVYLDNKFELEINLQAYQSKAEKTILRIAEKGNLVYQQSIDINNNLFSKELKASLTAASVGLHKYTVTLSDLKGEISTLNNSRQVTVEVINGRQKVLIAAEGPHPDIATLKAAIALNKHNEVTVALNEAVLKINPAQYALIILYQLPGLQGNRSSFYSQVAAAKVPLLYVIGAQTNLSQLNRLQTAVQLSGSTGLNQYSYSLVDPDFTAFDLDAASKKAIAEFDPLQSVPAQVKVAADARVALRQRNEKGLSQAQQLFFISSQERKTGYLIGEGIWKWKLSEARAHNGEHPVFNELISKTVQYLAVKDDKRKFRVYPAKPAFGENEHVILNATLYNDSYEPFNAPDVDIEIRNEQGKRYPFSFSKVETAYQLDAGLLPAGSYTYTARTKISTQQYQVTGAFDVVKLDAEFQQTIANHHLLYQLSAQTKGKFIMPAQVLAIADELKKSDRMKTLSYEDRRYEKLVNLKWLFFVIILLLTAEWFLRKRNSAT